MAESALSFIFPFPPAAAGIADYEAKLAALVRHPRVDDAIEMYLRGYNEYSKSLAPLVKLAFCDSYFMLETVLWYLHGLKEIEGKGHGATMSKLHVAAFADKFLSPRSVNTMIDRMIDMGHLVRVCDGGDGRVRRLVPTEACFDFSRGRVLLLSDAMKILYPASQLSEFIRSRPADYLHLDLEISRIGIAMNKAYRQFEELRFFSDHTGGFGLYISLFVACFAKWGALKFDVPVKVNLGDLADEHGVSKTQIRKLIRRAIEAGHIRACETDDEQVVLPRHFIESGRGTMAYWLLTLHEAEQRLWQKQLLENSSGAPIRAST